MTTVTQGSSANFTLSDPYDIITVAAQNSAQGRISVTSATGVQKLSLVFSDTRNLGPFVNTDVVSITSVRGSIDYVVGAYTPPVTGGGGSGTITSVNGKTTPVVVLTSADVGAVGTATSWAASAAGGIPTLTSGTAVLGSVYTNTTSGVTNLSPAIDGITAVQFGDKLMCFATGVYTLVPAGYIVGIYANASALQTAFPAANNGGSRALVGASAPYSTYQSDGSAWSIPTAVTPNLFGSNSFRLMPNGYGTTAYTSVGCASVPAAAGGTLTARSGSIGTLGYINRVGYPSTTSTANSQGYIGTVTGAPSAIAPTTDPLAQPQRMRIGFMASDALTACRMGAGFIAGAPTSTVEPSTILNQVWFAADSTDTQLTLMANDGSGTATKTVLNGGTGFPANTNGVDVYDAYIEFLGGTTRQVNYCITNLSTGIKASGSITAKLPVAGSLLRVGVYRNCAANTTAVPSFDFFGYAGGADAQLGSTS